MIEDVGGMRLADGIDSQGPWRIGSADVLERLSDDEWIDALGHAWLWLRLFVGAFDSSRDEVSCSQDGRAVTVAYALGALGRPRFTFDLSLGALMEVQISNPSGASQVVRFQSWSERDEHQVRWPIAWSYTDERGNETNTSVSTNSATCQAGESVRAHDACYSPPPRAFSIDWPTSGVVRVPMRFELGEIFVRVNVDDHVGSPVWALLDSAASTTAIDANGPVGLAFRSSLRLRTPDSDEVDRVGTGVVLSMAIEGGLRLQYVPIASMPMPVLDYLGSPRPEVVLGLSLFLAAAVRVDFANDTLTFARDIELLPREHAVAIPMAVLDGRFVANVSIHGAHAPLQIDTGNSGGVILSTQWAAEHGLPGSLPAYRVTALTGVGTRESESTYLRIPTVVLGPIRHVDGIASISSSPAYGGQVAGLLGNEVLAHCAAATFDAVHRTLWLEPPCDRKVPENLSGFRLKNVPDPQYPNNPWVIEKLVPGGSAELAGLHVGDRLTTIRGQPTTETLWDIFEAFEAPPGTPVVPLVIRRAGVEHAVTMVLRRRLEAPQ